MVTRRHILKGVVATGILSSVGASTVRSFSTTRPIMVSPNMDVESALLSIQHDRSTAISMAWIGHSTVLLNVNGKLVLTDPVLFNNIGVRIFGTTFGPRRITPPALVADKIPVPDLVLLSHAHMDHMDLSSLTFLSERTPNKIPVITAKNTADVIEHLPWASLQELDWGESFELGGMRIDALPVKHFGWRLPGEPDRSKGQKKSGRSFNSYLITAKHEDINAVRRIVFGGDTAYTESFKDLKFINGIDVAIMPVGAYNPWISVHCNPEQAVEMAQDMLATRVAPIHCMTFPLGREDFHEPRARLLEAVHSSSDLALGYTQIGQILKII